MEVQGQFHWQIKYLWQLFHYKINDSSSSWKQYTPPRCYSLLWNTYLHHLAILQSSTPCRTLKKGQSNLSCPIQNWTGRKVLKRDGGIEYDSHRSFFRVRLPILKGLQKIWDRDKDIWSAFHLNKCYFEIENLLLQACKLGS